MAIEIDAVVVWVVQFTIQMTLTGWLGGYGGAIPSNRCIGVLLSVSWGGAGRGLESREEMENGKWK